MPRNPVSMFASTTGMLATGLLIAGFTVQEVDSTASITVSKTYTAADFGSMQSLGACSVTPDTVSCWDASGLADPNLTEKIKAYYIVDANAEIRHRFGRKNRILVFQRPPNGYGGPASMSMVRTATGGYLNSAGQIGANGRVGEPYIEWYSVDSDPSATTASIQFDINLNLGTGVVPLKEGADGKIGPINVHVNSIQPLPDRSVNGTAANKEKVWGVSLTLSGYQGSTAPSFNGRVLDLHGVSISRVNAAGIPLPELSNRGGYNSFGGYQPPTGFDAGTQIQGGSGTPNLQLVVPVNPSKASALSLSATGIRKVKITDIPLDPK